MSRRASRKAAGAARAPSLVSWRAGVHICGTRLWCDAPRAQEVCFVSCVQALRRGRPSRQGTLLCTQRALLLRQALGEPARPPESLLLSPVGRPFHLGALRLELFPSGEAPGAASLWLKLPSGECVIYAGAPCAQPEPDVEPMQLRAADTLVCAAPLCAHASEAPERAAALARLSELCAEARAAQAATVVLCSPLTGGPAIHRQLTADGASVTVAAEVALALSARRAVASAEQRAADPLTPRRFRGPLAPGAVLLWPAGAPLPAADRLLGREARALHVLLCAGAALAEPVLTRLRATLPSGAHFAGAVALAEGLDRPALLRYIQQSEARTVYLTAGYSDALASTLRQAGVTLLPLGPPRQLALFAPGASPAA